MRLSIGRYQLLSVVGVGGMATVHLARLRPSAEGDSDATRLQDGPLVHRILAAKRIKPELARDAELALMFADEARVALRVVHPNVVATYDVVREGSELVLVMEYLHGESLSRLARSLGAQRARMPASVASAILLGVLRGLNAAHETMDEEGRPMRIVHRDISPGNVLVGADGVARILDFGVAKAERRYHETRRGEVKGKFAYMAPEQLGRDDVTRSADVYAAGVVLWEALTGQRLFTGSAVTQVVEQVLYAPYRSVRESAPELGADVDVLTARALARDPAERFASAAEMAAALEATLPPASDREVAAWVGREAGPALAARAALVQAAFEQIHGSQDL